MIERRMITVRMVPGLIEAIDGARGQVSREEWIRGLIKRELERDGGCVNVDTPKSSPMSAEASLVPPAKPKPEPVVRRQVPVPSPGRAAAMERQRVLNEMRAKARKGKRK